MLSRRGSLTFSLMIISVFTVVTLLGTPPISARADDAGWALDFDGENDYIVLEKTAYIFNEGWESEKSVNLWFKPHGSGVECYREWAWCPVIIADYPQWWGITRGVLNGQDRIWVWNYSNGYRLIGIPYTPDEWVNIAMVHTNGVLYAYKNGALAGSVASGPTQQPNTGAYPTLQLGGIISPERVAVTDGLIDEVRLWNHALTAQDILDNMYRSLNGDEAGLAAYYKMSDGQGTILTDDSVNSWDGTLYDGVPYEPPNGGPAQWVVSDAFANAPNTDPFVTSITRFDPNPTRLAMVRFEVSFSEDVTGVDVGDFELFSDGTLAGVAVGSVSGGSKVYTVSVNTGTGDGNLRLNVPGTADIADFDGNALGGLPFTSGETYTIDHAAIRPVSITRADPNPTGAASVDFIVTFSETAIGVGASDFNLTTTGGIVGASINGITGGPTAFTVSVSTGTGNGTIRLDVPNTAVIVDLVGNPLVGIPYTSGEMYDVDKTAPTVVSITRADPNPTSSRTLHFQVSFSKAVTGVDVTDFVLSSTGGLSGFSVTGVEGSGALYTVTATFTSGSGTLRLDVIGTATISDAVGSPLAGIPYETGEAYSVSNGTYLPLTLYP